MALVLKDRVLESSTSSGTGSFTLSGAQTGYQAFTVIGNGNTTYYTIQGKNSDGTLTGEWEVGVGTWSTGGTLSRDTVLESSNSNAKVDFAIGLKDVFCDLPAEYAGGGGGMTYPGAGIANSTGSAWGTSYTTSGTGTVVALATSPTFVTPALGTPSSGVVTNLTGTASININGTVGATTPSMGAFTYLSTSSTTSTTPVLSFNASNSGFAMGATISNNFLQTVLQNKSSTAGASTNYVLSNDLGTDSTYYGEFGMNSSVYSSGTPSDFFSLNNGTYFSSHDGDVTIGSGNGYKTYFAWGTAGQSAHVINASGAIGLNTSITGSTNFGTSGQALTSGGSSATPTWTTVVTPTSTDTLTNKRIDPRVSSTSSASSVTPTIASYDIYAFTALAATLTINAPTGTPVDGDKLTFRILDNGTAQTLTWNATYTAIGVTLPTTTVASKTMYVGCVYNAFNTRWDVVAISIQA